MLGPTSVDYELVVEASDDRQQLSKEGVTPLQKATIEDRVLFYSSLVCDVEV